MTPGDEDCGSEGAEVEEEEEEEEEEEDGIGGRGGLGPGLGRVRTRMDGAEWVVMEKNTVRRGSAGRTY